MKRFVWSIVAVPLCAAAAHSTDAVATRGYLMSGEALLFPRGASALPEGITLQPQGAQSANDLVLGVNARTDVGFDGAQIAEFTSGPLFTGEAEIEFARAGDAPLGLGSLVLTNAAGEGWTIYSASGELAGRPVLRFGDGDLHVAQISNDELALNGELFLHPAFAAEIGLSTSQSWLVGAMTLRATSYPGLQPSLARTTPALHSSSATTGGTTALGAGPDVIVSTVGSTLTNNGSVGGISAYSMTTVSCNIGTSIAEWFANNNQHPVIGQQIYRLKTVAGSTRFEQIGMSWLKHGFCAADAPSCGSPYQPNGSCDWLGLFATDTYSAGLNGQQSNLGPRSEIQPWTGAFTYPYVLGAGASGNAIYKRTQVANTDLDPAQNAGALYWGEVVYICTDEVEANRYNNYSYRRVTNGGAAGTALAFTGATITQQAAIQAWAANDTGVTLTTIDVPGDGRLILGSKVTDLSGLGNGPWHYEYALFNMNSHNGVNEFRVPLAAGVSTSNPGFHDVPYHSGEPYSGTDWTNAASGSEINWTTQEFAANVNANALRWSTTYNFRFDANSAPTTGTITLGLFRNNGTITVSAPVPDVTTGGSIGTFCFGDGSGTACPCGNNSTVGAQEGCLNSLGNGGKLQGSGTPSLSSDTVALFGSGMPDSSALYFQGTSQSAGGAGAVFGDGLRCAGGSVTRLGTKTNLLGSSQYPVGGDLSVSVRGGVAAPGSFTYQVWYRNAAAFCNPETFNLTNGVNITWGP